MKDATRSALVAGLAVLSVAVAAATLDSTVTPGRGGPVGPAGGDGTGGGVAPVGPGPTPGETVHLPLLAAVLAILAAVAVLALAAYAIRHRREALQVLAVGLVFVALGWLLVTLLRGLTGPVPFGGVPALASGNGSALGAGGSGAGGPDAVRPGPPSLVLLFVLFVALVSALVAVSRAMAGDGGDGGDDDPSASPGDDGATAAAVGRAAGRAADRLETARNVDNEVYRTWREMTDLLDVASPESSTPGEFAAAAVAAGLGREDVGELTRLFEDVRYGGTRPTDEHERRAVAVFRRIEDRYAGDDA